MGTYFSNTMISDLTLDFVFLPVLDAFAHVISWLYSVVDVVDKCFESMPRGPAGSSHGDFAEVEFTIGSTGTSSEPQQAIGAKIRNSLKLVEMASINSEVDTSHGEGTGNNTGDHVCAVCLGEIREEEKVYELPQCDHIFHSACLDRWVGHNHSTCPLCRTSLVTGCCCSGPTAQDEEVLEEEPGSSFGIWFVSRYATNINFSSNGWTHALMRLAGF